MTWRAQKDDPLQNQPVNVYYWVQFRNGERIYICMLLLLSHIIVDGQFEAWEMDAHSSTYFNLHEAEAWMPAQPEPYVAPE